MNLSYLSNSTISFLSTLLLVLVLIGSFFLAFVLLLLIGGYLFLFRKRHIYFHEDQVTTTGNIYAPVSGKVISIGEADGYKKIVIKTGLLNEYGIYLPFSCEVKDIGYDTQECIYRTANSFDLEKEASTYITLLDKKGREMSMQFLRFFTGMSPEIVLIPGDKGRRQVNFGFFPYGGLTILKMSPNAEFLADVGDRVNATETIVARFRNED
jgi:hypothetical protein